MKKWFFFDRVNSYRTGVAVHKAVEFTILINPHPAAADLIVIELALSGTKLTFNLRSHTYILSHFSLFHLPPILRLMKSQPLF